MFSDFLFLLLRFNFKIDSVNKKYIMYFSPIHLRNLLRIVVQSKSEAILIQNYALKQLGLGLRKKPLLMNLHFAISMGVYA